MIVQPPRIMPDKERLPALGGLVGEDDRADAVLAQHAAALGEGSGHRLPRTMPSILRTAIDVSWLVLDRLSILGREWVRRIKRIAQERMARQRALEPDKEEVGEIGVGNGVVVRRIGEPDARGLVGQRVLGSVCETATWPTH